MATVTISTEDGKTVNAKLEEWIGALLMTLTPKTTNLVLENLDKVRRSKSSLYSPTPLHTQLLQQVVAGQGNTKVIRHG